MSDIKKIIDYLSENISDPAPKYIFIKEILKESPTSPDYLNAYEYLTQSKWYRELAGEQWDDGSWGRFHTQDTKSLKKQTFVTTEAALGRARDLSLSKDDPMIDKCIKLMERHIHGKETWPDNIEKHKDGGRSHMHSRPFAAAANLNLFDPENPAMKPKRDIFVKTLKIALSKGYFDEAAWEQENRTYNGPCLSGWNAYP